MPKEYIGDAVNELLQIFQDLLEEYPLIGEMNEGFFEYQFAEYEEKTPLNVNALLDSQFHRLFNLLLKQVLEELRKEEALDKQKLHLSLLEKYLNIKLPCEGPLKASLLCNAYYSSPIELNSDELLHSYFLHPYKLFSISEDNRKYTKKSSCDSRRWHWQENEEDCDAAPFFREIIQLYILNSILEDYEEANNPFENELVLDKLEHLKILSAELLLNIPNRLRALFTSIQFAKNPLCIKGSPSGVFSENGEAFDEIFPELRETASYYPVGRLLFGQTPTINQHILAREASYDKDSIRSFLKYAYVFLYHHLNIPTSLFWAKTILSRTFSHWLALKKYVLGQTQSDRGLLYQGFRGTTTILFLMSSPLLILLPALYGLSSLPFTALRSLCIHGSFPRLKHYNILFVLDLIEAAKDFFIFLAIAMPALNVLFASIAFVCPQQLLSIGGTASFIFLFYAERMLAPNAPFLSYFDPNPLYALAMSPPFSLIGTSFIFSLGAYLGVGYGGRILHYLTPSVLRKPVSNFLSPITRLISRAENYVRNWLFPSSPKSEVSQTPCLALPKVSLYQPSDEILVLINACQRKLGQLNQAFYLEKERRALFKPCILALEINSKTTESSLAETIAQANICLANCFTAKETAEFSKILNYLTQDKSVAKTFRSESFFIQQPENQGVYQPSWKLLKLLKEKQFLFGPLWIGPEDIRPSSPLLDKCCRILALAPAVDVAAMPAPSLVLSIVAQNAPENHPDSQLEEVNAPFSFTR